MRLVGRVWKARGGKHWLIEVPDLDVATQGTSKNDAFAMIKDAIEGLVDQKGFGVTVHAEDGQHFTLSTNSSGALVALLLQRQRIKSGLSIRDVAARLESSSPNAYAQYERGDRMPTIEKFQELLQAIDPEVEPVIEFVPKRKRA